MELDSNQTQKDLEGGAPPGLLVLLSALLTGVTPAVASSTPAVVNPYTPTINGYQFDIGGSQVYQAPVLTSSTELAASSDLSDLSETFRGVDSNALIFANPSSTLPPNQPATVPTQPAPEYTVRFENSTPYTEVFKPYSASQIYNIQDLEKSVNLFGENPLYTYTTQLSVPDEYFYDWQNVESAKEYEGPNQYEYFTKLGVQRLKDVITLNSKQYDNYLTRNLGKIQTIEHNKRDIMFTLDQLKTFLPNIDFQLIDYLKALQFRYETLQQNILKVNGQEKNYNKNYFKNLVVDSLYTAAKISNSITDADLGGANPFELIFNKANANFNSQSDLIVDKRLVQLLLVARSNVQNRGQELLFDLYTQVEKGYECEDRLSKRDDIPFAVKNLICERVLLDDKSYISKVIENFNLKGLSYGGESSLTSQLYDLFNVNNIVDIQIQGYFNSKVSQIFDSTEKETKKEAIKVAEEVITDTLTQKILGEVKVTLGASIGEAAKLGAPAVPLPALPVPVPASALPALPALPAPYQPLLGNAITNPESSDSFMGNAIVLFSNGGLVVPGSVVPGGVVPVVPGGVVPGGVVPNPEPLSRRQQREVIFNLVKNIFFREFSLKFFSNLGSLAMTEEIPYNGELLSINDLFKEGKMDSTLAYNIATNFNNNYADVNFNIKNQLKILLINYNIVENRLQNKYIIYDLSLEQALNEIQDFFKDTLKNGVELDTPFLTSAKADEHVFVNDVGKAAVEALNSAVNYITEFFNGILVKGVLAVGALLLYKTKGFIFNTIINLYNTLQVYYNNPKKYLNSILIARNGEFRRARACPCWTLETLANRLGGGQLRYFNTETKEIKSIQDLNQPLINFLKIKRNEKVSVCFFVR